MTLVKLCRYVAAGRQPTDKSKLESGFLENYVLPQYVKLFRQLKEAHFREVLLQEPILVVDRNRETRALLSRVLEELKGGPKVHLVTFFDDLDVDMLNWLKDAPENLGGVSLDFTRGDNLSLLSKHSFPNHLTLGAGVIDARNVWRIDVCSYAENE